MKLSEFYKERMAANPDLTRRMLVDEIGSATVYAIQHDVPRAFRKSTLQKLAELWKCSQGDIQACMAELPNPLRAEAAKPEGQAGIVKDTVKKNAVDPEPAPEKVPIKWHEDERVDDVVLPEKPLKVQTIPNNSDIIFYKLHLKALLNKHIVLARMDDQMVSIYANFGYEVAQELLKGE